MESYFNMQSFYLMFCVLLFFKNLKSILLWLFFIEVLTFCFNIFFISQPMFLFFSLSLSVISACFLLVFFVSNVIMNPVSNVWSFFHS